MSESFICFLDDGIGSVYGVGTTASEAIEDARPYLLESARDQMIADIEATKQGETSTIQTIPASKALIEEVNSVGGDVPWHDVNGVAHLLKED